MSIPILGTSFGEVLGKNYNFIGMEDGKAVGKEYEPGFNQNKLVFEKIKSELEKQIGSVVTKSILEPYALNMKLMTGFNNETINQLEQACQQRDLVGDTVDRELNLLEHRLGVTTLNKAEREKLTNDIENRMDRGRAKMLFISAVETFSTELITAKQDGADENRLDLMIYNFFSCIRLGFQFIHSESHLEQYFQNVVNGFQGSFTTPTEFNIKICVNNTIRGITSSAMAYLNPDSDKKFRTERRNPARRRDQEIAEELISASRQMADVINNTLAHAKKAQGADSKMLNKKAERFEMWAQNVFQKEYLMNTDNGREIKAHHPRSLGYVIPQLQLRLQDIVLSEKINERAKSWGADQATLSEIASDFYEANRTSRLNTADAYLLFEQVISKIKLSANLIDQRPLVYSAIHNMRSNLIRETRNNLNRDIWKIEGLDKIVLKLTQALINELSRVKKQYSDEEIVQQEAWKALSDGFNRRVSNIFKDKKSTASDIKLQLWNMAYAYRLHTSTLERIKLSGRLNDCRLAIDNASVQICTIVCRNEKALTNNGVMTIVMCGKYILTEVENMVSTFEQQPSASASDIRRSAKAYATGLDKALTSDSIDQSSSLEPSPQQAERRKLFKIFLKKVEETVNEEN